jgi:Fe-S cluster assembly ATP-binding protein
VLAGHPGYEPTAGSVTFAAGSPRARARRALAGRLFLAFQYPVEIPGVSIANFLRTAVQSRLGEGRGARHLRVQRHARRAHAAARHGRPFAERHVNDGFSGGEKKRNEILQMAVLKPRLAVMDETDSGLDIDALKVVANGVNTLLEEDPEMSILLITHYQRLLNYIEPITCT